MIGTVDIKVNAAHPNMPLSALYTFLGSPQQVRIINVPKAIGNWKITAVQVTVNYPDNSSPSVEATLVGGCWSATLPAPSAVGQSLMGFKVTASGVDEHNDPVTGYVLGKGDAYVLDDDATITVGGTTYYVHMLDAVPETPRKGDLAVIDNIYQLYDGSRWHPLGNQATISWSDITGKPTEFPPEAHAASHKTGGTDALTPGDIGAVAAVPGKGLSTNDYTTAEKTKLAGIEAGAEVNPTPVAPSTEIEYGAVADAKEVAEFVNSSINAMAAYYITKNVAGDAFATKAELTAAIASGTFYNGGQLRVPTKNDYLYVLADESATQIIPGVNPTTRYSYDGGQWAFQIVVNNTALTSAQVAAINSNITAALVSWLVTFKGADTSTTLASVLSALAGKLDKSGAHYAFEDIADGLALTAYSLRIKYPSGDAYISFGSDAGGGYVQVDFGGGVRPRFHFPYVEDDDYHPLALQSDLAAYLADNTPNYSATSTYAVGAVVKYNGALYVCKTAITTAEVWTPAHWTAMPGVSALFSLANTANDAANINYTATGETATTVKAKIKNIETLVGTANADLEDALNGTEAE